MDLPSPSSLQDLCINLLVKKPEILWRWKGNSVFFTLGEVEWRDPEVLLQSQFADKILENLSRGKRLTGGILRSCTEKHVSLENVKIYHCIGEDGLQVLSNHKLKSLHIRFQLHMNICTLLQCIGNKSCESLQHLVLHDQRGSLFRLHGYEKWAGQFVSKRLLKFKCLKNLDISYTDLTDTMLTFLGKSLLHVENLNLSWNPGITDISPLKNCQKTLKSLFLCGLYDMEAESAMATFVTLTGLTYLDVSLWTTMPGGSSEEYEFDRVSPTHGKEVFRAAMLLQMPDILPNLVYLDLSPSRKVTSEHALRQFLDAHPSLRTLMLWGSDACEFKSLQDYPQLTVGGHATLDQYAAVLRHMSRGEEHQGHLCPCLRRFSAVCKLSRNLEEKHFPPCNDDRLVQLLSLLPIHPRDQITWPGDACFCLEAISLLLEKGVVRHLEPKTKQQVVRFCHMALQQPIKSSCLQLAVFDMRLGDDIHVFARNILKRVE